MEQNENISPLVYTPIPTKQQPLPPTEYVLVEDVSRKPPVKRGAQILTDSKGRKFQVPYPPKSGCKKCYGRGYIGFDPKTNSTLPCKKCYPML